MIKFGLQYKITIQISETEAIIVQNPFTIDFNIVRNNSSTLNQIALQIYNLSATHRSQIFLDPFNVRRFQMIVEMGYDNLSRVFVGDIYQAGSTRQGSDIITTIIARDGNFDVAYSNIAQTLTANKPISEVLTFLMEQFPNLKPNIINNTTPGINDTLLTPVVLNGNTYELIKRYANTRLNTVYIDLEVINIYGQNEVVVNEQLEVISADTGLINTPSRCQSSLSVTTLLESRMVMSQIINLESKIQPQYNGIYKVIGITHRGRISGSVESNCESVFNLMGNQLLGGFTTVQ